MVLMREPRSQGICITNFFGGRQMTLPRVPSASGEKYESGTAGSPEYAMLWLRGDRAQFQWGSRRFPECERQAL